MSAQDGNAQVSCSRSLVHFAMDAGDKQATERALAPLSLALAHRTSLRFLSHEHRHPFACPDANGTCSTCSLVSTADRERGADKPTTKGLRPAGKSVAFRNGQHE